MDTSASPASLAYTPNPAGNGVTERAAYVDLSQTISTILRKANEGRIDPAVRGWAGDALIAHGRPASNTAKMLALRTELQKATVFVPDPTGADYIVSAAGTLCLRPGLCVRATDCDDRTVVMLAAGNSIGIHCQLVEQHYDGAQPHVFVAYETVDGNGVYEYLDPSTDWAPGTAASAVSEVWHDPLSYANPELVGVGAPPSGGSAWIAHRQLVRDSEGWLERDADGWWRYTGAGWVPASFSPIGAPPPAPAPTGTWVPLNSESEIVAGSRYYVSFITPATHLDDVLGDWDVDQTTLTPGDVTVGFARSYRFVGVAKVSAPKSTSDIRYLSVFAQVASSANAPGAPPPDVPLAPLVADEGVTYTDGSGVITVAALAAVLGGVYWGLKRKKTRRR